MRGQKHLVECKCILSQYKNIDPPVFHSFVVFSVINDKQEVIPSYAQCNHCGAIHKIIDICESEILNKESLANILSIDELKLSLNNKVVQILEMNECPLYVWEEVKFIFENEMWKKYGQQVVILSKEEIDNKTVGKYLIIINENLFTIRNFERTDIIEL